MMSTQAMLALMLIAAAMVFCGFLAIWSRRDTMARHWAMLALILGLGSVVMAAITTAGWPKPIAWEFDTSKPLKIVGVHFDQEGTNSIYILVDRGFGLPRTYSLPWSDKAAKELHEAMQKTEDQTGESGALLMWRYDESATETEIQFYPLPQQASPPKAAQEPGFFYQQIPGLFWPLEPGPNP